MTAISVLNRVTKADIVTHPFPHVLIENALPSGYFRQLEHEYPSFELIAGPGPHRNNHAHLKSTVDIRKMTGVSSAWREFVEYHSSEEFYREVAQLFQEYFQSSYPELERKRGRSFSDFTVGLRSKAKSAAPDAASDDIKMDVQLGVNSPVLESTSVRSAHLDSRYKLFAGLLYFRDPNDKSTGGELELYKYDPNSAKFDLESFQLTRGEFETVRTVPYRANNLILWANSLASLHGVSPRSVTNVPRRYINLLGETYKDYAGLYQPPGDGRSENNSNNSIWQKAKRLLRA